MAFERRYWVDGRAGGTLINGDNLNRMEAGIEAAGVSAATALTQAQRAVTDAGSAKTVAAAASAKVDQLASSIPTSPGGGGGTVVAVTSVSAPDALELMASRIDTRTGDLRVGIASDSTANDTGDWPRIWLKKISLRWPYLRIVHRLWDDATQKYGADQVYADGQVLTPASDGNYLVDTFTRTAADVVGTKTDNGLDWVGQTGKASVDGSALKFSTFGNVGVNAGVKTGTLTVHVRMTTNSTVAQQLRFYVGTPGVTTGRGVYVYLGMNASGAVSCGLAKNSLAVGAVTIGAFTGHGLASSSATEQVAEVTLKMDGQNVTATLGVLGSSTKGTLTHQLTEAEYAEFGSTIVASSSSTDASKMAVDKLTYSGPAIPERRQTLEVLNGAKPGGNIQYQQDRLLAMYGSASETPGGGGTPDTTVTELKDVLKDTFTRTGALSGSTPDVGSAWAGNASWSANGSQAVPSTAPGLPVYTPIPAVSGALTVDVAAVTAARAEVTTLRAFLGGDTSGTNGLCIFITVNVAGAPAVGVYSRTTAGGYRVLGALDATGITAASATAQRVSLKLAISGLDVTGTVTNTETSVSKTATWTLTQAELDELLTLKRATLMNAAGTNDCFKVDSLVVNQMATTTVPGTPAGPPTPGKPMDVLVIAHGHNYGALAASSFTPLVETFVTEVKKNHPNVLPLISSQNPQVSPAAAPAAHAERQVAMRQLARTKGWSYIGAFEKFVSRPDGGASLIVPGDGIHPNTSPTASATDDTYGGNVWAQVALDTLVSRSLS